MPGLFQSLELGKRALLTHQGTLQTIGHNIANVNTPGYTRQRVEIRTTYPEVNAIGSFGSGVKVTDIRHIRDLFLGQQLRQENKSLGQWSYKQKILSQMEGMFGEPNENTLSDLMNKFWDSWSDLSTDPTSTSNRVAVIEQTRLLTNGFRQAARQLTDLRDSIDRDLVNYTEDVNRLSVEIARLNQQIKKQELGSNHANDLRDTRDHLIDELSSLVDVNTREEANGMTVVYIGAMAIVDGPDTLRIATEAVNDEGTMTHKLVWEGTDREITNLNGQINGLLEARDEIIPGYMEQLDKLVADFVEQVNGAHSSGYGLNGTTGVNFFDGRFKTATNVKINHDIVIDPRRIAASGSGEVGDNTVALAISEMRNERTMLDGTATFNQYYNSIIGRLGIETHEARSFKENLELVVNQLEISKESVQGVSLDEEMTNMVKYQHAYDAAARVITTMDQALDTVISGMGIVGR